MSCWRRNWSRRMEDNETLETDRTGAGGWRTMRRWRRNWSRRMENNETLETELELEDGEQ